MLFSRSVMSNSVIPWTAACQASLSFTISWSLLKLSPLSWWCHPTISSSVVPFSFCLIYLGVNYKINISKTTNKNLNLNTIGKRSVREVLFNQNIIFSSHKRYAESTYKKKKNLTVLKYIQENLVETDEIIMERT